MKVTKLLQLALAFGLAFSLLSPPNNTHAQESTGTIVGVVRDTNGNPISGVDVCALNYDQGGNWICAQTEIDGTYIVANIPGGDYRVSASAPNWGLEHYSQAFSWWAATRVTVIGGMDTTGIDFVLLPGGQISGTVYQSDGTTPISNISVVLHSSDSSESSKFFRFACTDENGHYSFNEVAYGVEWLIVSGGGLGRCFGSPTIFSTEYWQETNDWNDATALVLSENMPGYVGVDFTLEQVGTISGTLRDENGNLLSGILIKVKLESITEDLSIGTCTDTGTYTIYDIPLGTYLVSAGGDCGSPTSNNLDWEYWHESAGFEGLVPIVISTTQFNLDGIDFTLSPTDVTKGGYSPYIISSVQYNIVYGEEWASEVAVTLTIDDPTNGPGVDYSDSAEGVPYDEDPSLSVVTFELQGFSLEPGMIIKLTNGYFTRKNIATSLSVQGLDVSSDKVYGVSPPYTLVWAWCLDDSEIGGDRFLFTDSTGHWTADFGVAGPTEDEQTLCDLKPGTFGAAMQIEPPKLNGYTQFEWEVTNPSFANLIGENGGTLATPDSSLAISVPAGALSGNVVLSITDNGNGFMVNTNEGEIKAVMAAEVGPAGTTFATPITITFQWLDVDDDGIVDGINTPERDLLVSKDGTVIAGPCGQDQYCNTTNNTYSVQVSSLSFFTLGFLPIEPRIGIEFSGQNVRIRGLPGDPGDWEGREGENRFRLMIVDPTTSTTIVDLTSDSPSFRLATSDVKPGYEVTLEDTFDPEFAAHTTVIDLKITEVEYGGNRVSGNTNLLSKPIDVDIRCAGVGGDTETQSATLNEEDGSWYTELDTTLYLECKFIYSSQTDGKGHYQSYRWPYVNRFYADPQNDVVDVEAWPPPPIETGVKIFINDELFVDEIGNDTFVVEYDERAGYYMIQIPLNDIDLLPGDEVKVQSVKYSVSTQDIMKDAQITYVDIDKSEVHGTIFNDDGTPVSAYEITVFAGDDLYETSWRDVETDALGNFVAYFDDGAEGALKFSELEKVFAAIDVDRTEITWPYHKERTVGSLGRTVFTPNVTVEVPPDALTQAITLEIEEGGGGFEVSTDQGPMATVFSATINPAGTTFDLPATITLKWDDSIPGIEEDFLYVSKDGVIIAGPCSQDLMNCNKDNNTYSVQVSSLSFFTLGSLLNQPPEILSIQVPVEPISITSTLNVSGTFVDPDNLDVITAVWDWGDGETSSGTVSDSTVIGEHNYSSPGVYTVSLLVTDSFQVSDTMTSNEYIVIYDPEGGFVTGGGWVWSPGGAYTPNLSLTGKATFGFVSKYKHGATVPTGNTEFQFKVADLNFKSTSYDWLVIAGSKAKYKGTGSINGTGEYGFMLSAIDGTPDKFRIKIWDKETGDVVYDNQLGAADDADLVTVIEGGSIVIHKEK